MDYKELTELFQCPGCISGGDTKCGKYCCDVDTHSCSSHVLGTQLGFGNYIALGLPKGFNKPGVDEKGYSLHKIRIRFPDKNSLISRYTPWWDHLNIPVWALEQDGFLFVRTYCPRLNVGYVDVIEGGTLSLVPKAINVAEFIQEID